MSYSITVTARKSEAAKQFEEKMKAAEGSLSDESKKQLEIAKSVLDKELELAEDDSVISVVASGHTSPGYVNGTITVGVYPSGTPQAQQASSQS